MCCDCFIGFIGSVFWFPLIAHFLYIHFVVFFSHFVSSLLFSSFLSLTFSNLYFSPVSIVLFYWKIDAHKSHIRTFTLNLELTACVCVCAFEVNSCKEVRVYLHVTQLLLYPRKEKTSESDNKVWFDYLIDLLENFLCILLHQFNFRAFYVLTHSSISIYEYSSTRMIYVRYVLFLNWNCDFVLFRTLH